MEEAIKGTRHNPAPGSYDTIMLPNGDRLQQPSGGRLACSHRDFMGFASYFREVGWGSASGWPFKGRRWSSRCRVPGEFNKRNRDSFLDECIRLKALDLGKGVSVDSMVAVTACLRIHYMIYGLIVVNPL